MQLLKMNLSRFNYFHTLQSCNVCVGGSVINILGFCLTVFELFYRQTGIKTAPAFAVGSQKNALRRVSLIICLNTIWTKTALAICVHVPHEQVRNIFVPLARGHCGDVAHDRRPMDIHPSKCTCPTHRKHGKTTHQPTCEHCSL